MIYFDSKNIGPIIPYEFPTIQNGGIFRGKSNKGGIWILGNLVYYENNKMANMIGGNISGRDFKWVANL